ncbi:glutamate decarboxylase 1-like [Rhinatrema bivittatum]|uniref:glutamate decarboxylase 1-like n=1 Tax=Rhinatrema bivittatum TaxID=194408 RepID=UPI00112ABB08|nr:glutamate decarboxylase 1-like [Rhinatrema bivittatum]
MSPILTPGQIGEVSGTLLRETVGAEGGVPERFTTAVVRPAAFTLETIWETLVDLKVSIMSQIKSLSDTGKEMEEKIKVVSNAQVDMDQQIMTNRDKIKNIELTQTAMIKERKNISMKLERMENTIRKLLPARNGEKCTEHFLLAVMDILLSYIKKTFDGKSKVLDFHHPHQLLDGLEGFSLELSDKPEPLEQILVDCRDTLKYGVKTGHPCFFNQLSSGLDIVGLAGEWLTATANTNMFTYEIAPVFIVMEEIILKKMHELVGWGENEADGIFSPGGTISNLYSVLVARYKYFPDVKTKGMMALPQIVLFVSEHSHYSLEKASAVLGIGTDNVIAVKSDERGKIIPSDLEAKILEAKKKGQTPFYVCTTAGTTVYGAFDPLANVADICEKYGLWMHVDAAWGGGLLMSKKHAFKLNGIERANSVTWNPHKMMGVPLQCSVILIREKGLLHACNHLNAGYLFQPDKQYNIAYDTGDKTIQCGRHVDVFKLWLMWKAKGTCGFELQINKCLELAEYLYKKLKTQENFELVLDTEPELTNVCFWYIPQSLRKIQNKTERNKKLDQIAPKIKAQMMEEGATMVSYQPLGDKVNFFRMVLSNPAAKKSDVDFLIKEIERIGKNL